MKPFIAALGVVSLATLVACADIPVKPSSSAFESRNGISRLVSAEEIPLDAQGLAAALGFDELQPRAFALLAKKATTDEGPVHLEFYDNASFGRRAVVLFDSRHQRLPNCTNRDDLEQVLNRRWTKTVRDLPGLHGSLEKREAFVRNVTGHELVLDMWPDSKRGSPNHCVGIVSIRIISRSPS